MTKEEKREYDKKYRENNKEKIREKDKKYNENNKEKIKETNKKYHENNKEKIREKNKKYRENNREKIKEKDKKYMQTEEGKKSRRIKKWKYLGVKHDDFDSLYEYYINTWNCELCNVKLVEGCIGANKKCLDHNHKTGEFRNVLCHICNIRRRDKLPLTKAERNWKNRLKKFILS